MASDDMKKTLKDLENSLKKIKIHEKNISKIVKDISKSEKAFKKLSSISDFKVDKNSFVFPVGLVSYKKIADKDFSGFFGSSDSEENLTRRKAKKLTDRKFMDKKVEREYRLLAFITGIPPETPVSDIKQVIIEKKSGGKTNFTFKSKNYDITQEYDFNTKTLTNNFINIANKGGEDISGGGLNILVRQIANLKTFGKIKKIEGEFLKSQNFSGYYVFLRYGFIPDKVAQSTYSDLMDEYNSLYPNDNVNKIEDFLKSETGRNFWKEKGNDWDGHFDLSDNSYSMKILEDYVKNKIDKDLFNLTFK
jgi:hypothetical protein